jgi:hypothetical protein
MKRILALMILSITNCVIGDEKSQVPDNVPVVSKERPMSFWMAQKIDYSKKILEALTKEDFAKVESDAIQLRTLGKIEGFVRRKDPVYLRHQQSFDSSLLDIAAQAQAHNVEGAALAFNQMTTSCIVCHKVLRAIPADPSAKAEAKTEAK